ncbi:MAG: hypothetical protein IKR76_10705 [Ruminococcus sp.]|nr:hypothetical protein [Ruminococcus sp.]
MRHKKQGPKQEYLNRYPGHKKWINTCICCGKSGYDPKMPEVVTVRSYGHDEHPTHIAKYIRFLYTLMAVDGLGRCDECRKASDKALSEDT